MGDAAVALSPAGFERFRSVMTAANDASIAHDEKSKCLLLPCKLP
jgi:hypothetical protein